MQCSLEANNRGKKGRSSTIRDTSGLRRPVKLKLTHYFELNTARYCSVNEVVRGVPLVEMDLYTDTP